jgi:hypothetical protein
MNGENPRHVTADNADKRLYILPAGDNAACQIFSPNGRIYRIIS